MEIPDSLRYTREHEWARLEDDGTVTMGITDYAQDALGDIVYVALPHVGDKLPKDGTLGEVESTKSVSEVFAPCAGEVVAVNLDLSDSPERINSDPYGEGWMARISPSEPAQLDSLLDAAGYRALVEGDEG